MQNVQAKGQEMPPGMSQKEWETVQEFIKQHLDARVQETIDFIPEMLEKRGLQITRIQTWKDRAKAAGVVFAAACVGGVVGALVYRQVRARKDEREREELESQKERGDGNRVRPVGRTSSVALMS